MSKLGRRTNAEIIAEHLKLSALTPERPYDIIERLEQRLADAQALLRQSRLNEARLLLMLDALLDEREQVA